jgi:hypothetical protein
VALERLLEALAFYERDWMTTYTGYGAVSAMKEQARAALASQPAADLDVERLVEALYLDVTEAQAIIEREGFVFARRLDQVTAESDEAARWEKLAFTFYTMLTPSAHRLDRIAAAYRDAKGKP